MRADAAGGTVWPVCDFPRPIEFQGGAWTSDGQIVYALMDDGLFRVSASGGTPVRLTTPDRSRGERAHQRPQLLPRSRFLYLAASDLAANSAIYAAPLARPSDRVRLLDALASRRYVDPFLIALIYFRLGERDTGFAYLEKAYTIRCNRSLLCQVSARLELCGPGLPQG